MTGETQQGKVDFRIYVGILFFRWKIIVLCFLYCLLGGVLYTNLAPKRFQAECKVMVYRDPSLDVYQQNRELPGAWQSSHVYMLQSDQLRERVVSRLIPQWGEIVGDPRKMLLDVKAERTSSFGPTLQVAVSSEHRDYAEAFLSALVDENEKEWQRFQDEKVDSATKVLSDELTRLEERIRSAEESLIEYQRLHDVARVDAKATMENQYLSALMARRSQVETELMLLEAQFPTLKDARAGVLGDVGRLTQETGGIEPLSDEVPPPNPGDKKPPEAGDAAPITAVLPAEFRPQAVPGVDDPRTGVQSTELSVKLTELKAREKELLTNLKPDHPSAKALREEILQVESALESAARVQLGKLQDRYEALRLQLSAVESAEFKWQAKNLLARQRKAEYGRLAAVVDRYEKDHATLYSRLNELRVNEELKAEHFRVVEPVKTEDKPVWPDPVKVLLVALAMGLGSGFGLALLLQVTDNKVQSIGDVERELGVPFLGGVPFWAHSGLEKAIRPIVTEENASGAIEAYRALRTSLLASLGKINEKIVMVTSADAREGKTLTSLNLAIMIAQMDKKVLLVDMDLRRGRLHRSLGTAREPGMTDALNARGGLRDIIQKTRIDNLWLIPTGGSVENASELLQSSDLVGMFAEIQESFDYIMIDTSPVLRVTDTVISANQGLGVVVYVARVNKTSKPMIQYSLGMLKESRVLGLIMNSIEMHRLSSLYYAYQYPNYAYYSNAYVYGYNYHHDDGMINEAGWGGGIAERWRHGVGETVNRLRRALIKEDR